MCTCLVLSRRHEIRTFDGNCSDTSIRLLVDNLHRSTTPTSHRVTISSGRPVDPRVSRRWTPRFLHLPRSWPRTSQTAAAPMNLLRPASLPLPRQRLFLRRSSGGTTSCYIERRYYFRCVEHYIFIAAVISELFHMICLSVSRLKRLRIRRRTYFPDVRIVATTYFRDVRILSTYVFYGCT